jgi:hypothetical protein
MYGKIYRHNKTGLTYGVVGWSFGVTMRHVEQRAESWYVVLDGAVHVSSDVLARDYTPTTTIVRHYLY